MAMNSLTIRVPDELREKLEKEAREDGRSLSNLITKILNEYVSRKEENQKDI